MNAIDEATRVRTDALEKRFDSVNEFRQTLSDQAATFATRQEVKAEIEKLCITLDQLKEYKNKLEGKASMSSVIFVSIISFLGFLISAIALLREFVK